MDIEYIYNTTLYPTEKLLVDILIRGNIRQAEVLFFKSTNTMRKEVIDYLLLVTGDK